MNREKPERTALFGNAGKSWEWKSSSREETAYEYPDGPYGFAFYDGVIISGEPEKRVHLEIRWVSPEELTDFSFCPADRPMVERLSRPL